MPIVNGILISDSARLKYLKRRQEDLELLRMSLAYKTFSEFSRIGHQIKGNASTFGFYDFEKIGIELEEAASSENSEIAASVLNQFEHSLRFEFQKNHTNTGT